MRGAITAIICGTLLYFFGLWGGACGIAKLWTIRAEQAAYEKGYRDGARAMQRHIQEIQARSNAEV